MYGSISQLTLVTMSNGVMSYCTAFVQCDLKHAFFVFQTLKHPVKSGSLRFVRHDVFGHADRYVSCGNAKKTFVNMRIL